jgi:outer membrane protein assembly factor BamB
MKRAFMFFAFAIAGCESLMASNDTLAIREAAVPNIVKSSQTFNFRTQSLEFTVPNDNYQFITDKNAKYIVYRYADPKTKNTEKPQSIIKAYRVSDMKLLFSMEVPQLQGQTFNLVESEAGMLLVENINNIQIAVYNAESGNKLWSKKFSAWGNMRGVVGMSNGIAVLRMAPAFGNLYFSAFSLVTGEKLWTDKLNAMYGLSYCQPIDKNYEYMVTDALYRVNMNTGEHKKVGTTSTAVTFKDKEIKKLLEGANDESVSGMVYLHSLDREDPEIGPMTTKFCVPWGVEKKANVVGLSSAILSKDGKNYFADRNSLICFDDEMNEVWRTELTDKATRSDLYMKGDVIYLINHAVGIFDVVKNALQFECAYVAAFDAKDGHQLYLKKVDKDVFHVDDVVVVGNKIHMLSRNQEAVFDMDSKEMTFNQMNIKFVKYMKYDYKKYHLQNKFPLKNQILLLIYL